MKNSTKSIEVSLKEVGALAGYAMECLVKASLEQIPYWLYHKKEFRENLLKAFAIDENIQERKFASQFYKNHLGWDVDFSRVSVPLKPTEGRWILLFIAEGLTANKMYNAWNFAKWKYADDLDKAVPTHKRIAKESYAIWVRDGVEPDEEFLGKSTRDADPNMEIGMTLPERLVFEQWYLDLTGEHPDKKGVTFCTASRNVDGDVPDVSWDPYCQEVDVNWYYVGDSDPQCGLRRAVS